MPGALGAADSIRILVSTDNHVGYNERDANRSDDSWKTFHEIMCLAKEQDVDMVLLAGDLFHDNKPSRKALFNVMRSMRLTCLGEKPCELEMLSDGSEVFQGAFNHVNYEDPDMNIAIPVFSIHGNHDDPSGEGHLAALDILQTAGLINYYGRTPESDNIEVKPVLLQKGQTKLALYGMSNVRDERLFRTFRDGKVKFFQPSTQKEDWFNLMSVHQNHYAHTEKGYLPENFLPDFLDLVIWGHEHECLIEPTYNPETGFHVMQPGSSVATSLMPGEAVSKHVAILTITGRDFKVEPIRLKTVRPFVMREIVLAEEKEALKIAKKANHRSELTNFLKSIVEEMISQAKAEWREARAEDENDSNDPEVPRPLIRLRVEYTAPDGYTFDLDNPQRFSTNFTEKVANVTDIVQFHKKKAKASRRTANGIDIPEESTLASIANESAKVEQIIREFLSAQSLTLLPQNKFGEAVAQFVDNDDKHALDGFIDQTLKEQNAFLVNWDKDDDEGLMEGMGENKSNLEKLWGQRKADADRKRRPRPEEWDADLQGEWDRDIVGIARPMAESDDDSDEAPVAKPAKATRGRAKAAPAKATKETAKKGRTKARDLSEEDSDVVMVDSNGEDSPLFVQEDDPPPATRKSKKTSTAIGSTTARRAAPTRAAAVSSRNATRQTQLSFSQSGPPSSKANGKKPMQVEDQNGNEHEIEEISDDDDDDDAFEPITTAKASRKRR